MFRNTVKAFEREIEEMDRSLDRLWSDFRSVDWSHVPVNKPLYYGVSITVGPDHVPHVQEFGNVSPGNLHLLGEGVREPFVQIVTDAKAREAHVTAELPGVEKDKVSVEATDDGLVIKADSRERKYEKFVDLDFEIDPTSVKARLNNGVLDITMRLAGAKTMARSRRVPVE